MFFFLETKRKKKLPRSSVLYHTPKQHLHYPVVFFILLFILPVLPVLPVLRVVPLIIFILSVPTELKVKNVYFFRGF